MTLSLDRSRELATLLQMLRRAREAESAEQLGFVAVNESLSLLSYRQAALWREGLHRHVGALSGLAELDASAPYVQFLGRLFRHLAQDQDAAEARRLQADHLPEALASEWSQWLPAQALYLPLQGQGALLLAREPAWSEHELKLAAELAHGYGHALLRFAPRHPARALLRRWLGPGSRRRWLLLAALLIACVPVRLSVLARAEVVPQDPRLLRAPLSGVIDRIHVQPNQRVKAGDALFELDATALTGQYALAARERESAQESFRASAQLAVTDDKGKLAMAQERARLEEKSIAADYTGRELKRLQVLAPAEGVVVYSDRSDWQGKAVVVGEKVMTLADPAHVELVAWLPAAEAIDVAPGARITLYPNASPLDAHEAEVLRVSYRAEPVEGGLLAYRIQARFLAPAVPRLGQLGTARVQGRWVPLAYHLLRRPLTAARQWLGW